MSSNICCSNNVLSLFNRAKKYEKISLYKNKKEKERNINSNKFNYLYQNKKTKDKIKYDNAINLKGNKKNINFSKSDGYNNKKYIEQKNNKYIGLDLNLISNSSHRDNNNKLKEEEKNNNNEIEDSKINIEKITNKKMELNYSSTPSQIQQNNNFENISINESTPAASFYHPYEADSSPTNYVKTYSNINNLTSLTINDNNNNNKKCDNSDISYNINNSNKKSEKEEIKNINRLWKNKKKKKTNNSDCDINNNDITDELMNLKDTKQKLNSQIEKKEEEYLCSLNNKIITSKGEKEEEKNNKDLNKNLFKSIKIKIENKVNKEINSLLEENNNNNFKERKKDGEENIIKDKIGIDNFNQYNLENKNEEEKLKSQKNIIEIKDMNTINNIKKVEFNDPKRFINAKLNFNYFSMNNFSTKDNKIQTFKFVHRNNNNLKESKTKSKESLFYSCEHCSNINYSGKTLEQPKLRNINPQKQIQIELKSKDETQKEKYKEKIIKSFQFSFIQKDIFNNKRKLIKKYLMNNQENDIILNLNKENYNIDNTKISLENIKKRTTNTKDVSTQYNNESSEQYYDDEINKKLINSSYLKEKTLTKKKKNILFDFEKFKEKYDSIKKEKYNMMINSGINTTKIELKNKVGFINNIPHHNKIGSRNNWTNWNGNSLIKGKTEQSDELFPNDKLNKNKFNRKLNSSVFPVNPFDSVNRAREFFFFN